MRANDAGMSLLVASVVAAAACTGGAETGGDGAGGDDGPGSSSSLSASFASASEIVWEGTGTWPIEVTVSKAMPTDLPIQYEVAGTATGGGVDHGLASGTVVLPAGQTSVRILVPIVNDSVVEPAETVQVTLI